MDNEFVPIKAFLEHLPVYKQNPVLLLGHNHKTTPLTLPIGKCLDIKPTDQGQLWSKFYVAPTQVGNDCLTLLESGCLRGLSFGFIPRKFIPNPTDHQLPLHLRGKGIRKYYQEVELVEISLLSIPSNRDSLVIASEKGNKVADLILKGFDGEDISPIQIGRASCRERV